MIMKDYVTPQERLNFNMPSLLDDYAHMLCMGCYRTTEQIAIEEGYTDDDFDNNSKTTLCGNWYHHIDCYKDSR